MIYAIISVVVLLGYLLFGHYKTLQKYKKLEHIDLGKYECFEYYKTPILIVLGFAVIGLIYVVFSFIRKDYITLIIGVGIFVGSIIQVWMFYKTRRFYYNNRQCIIDYDVVEYRMIDTVEYTSTSLLAVGKVSTFGKQTYTVNGKCCEIIEKKMDERKQRA